MVNTRPVIILLLVLTAGCARQAEQAPAIGPNPTPPSIASPSQLLTEMRVEPAFPTLSFDQMVHLTYPEDGTGRLFVVLQPGQIVTFENDPKASWPETFLDIRDRVNDSGDEEGLLGLAFDPQYKTNGFFYVYYSASRPRRSTISRFSVSTYSTSRADPVSELVILEVPQPYNNHNGGHLLFGPDGYLYIGLGDGGAVGDPHGNGQNTSTLLGSILRIDVSSLATGGTYQVPTGNPFVARNDGTKQEIWAYGLRNPWRFTFDRATGELWAADVGQDLYEEVNLIKPGLNYGWNVMEGFHCFKPSRSCDQEGLEPPVTEYSSSEGCSVIGGYVYRGPRLASLYGAYLYGDFCSGRIWALRYDGSRVTEHLELIDSQLDISSFGEGQSGEIFILSFDERIYRLTQR